MYRNGFENEYSKRSRLQQHENYTLGLGMKVSIKVRAAAETTNLSLKCFIGCRDSHLSSCVRCVVWLPCIGCKSWNEEGGFK